MRTIVVFFADTHAGHRLGLMKPDITLYHERNDGQLIPWTPELTDTQRYLWDCYHQDLARVAQLAGTDPIIVHHVGDLTQGMKYRDQLVSTRLADQLLIARSNMLQWLSIPNVRRFDLIVGTRSHIFSEATSPILVREMITPAFADTPINVIYHTRPTIDRVIFDAAHHGPSSGIREWTQGNQLRYYLKSLVIHDILRGRHPPALAVRAHFHKLWPETVRIRLNRTLLAFLTAMEHARTDDAENVQIGTQDPDVIDVYQADIVLLPSYCGMGEYGRQATGSSSTLSNGLIAAEIINGRLVRTHTFERELDIRHHEVISLPDGTQNVCSSEKTPPGSTDRTPEEAS